MKNIRSKVKNVAKTTKLVGFDLPKEVLKRLISPKHTMNRVFGKKK